MPPTRPRTRQCSSLRLLVATRPCSRMLPRLLAFASPRGCPWTLPCVNPCCALIRSLNHIEGWPLLLRRQRVSTRPPPFAAPLLPLDTHASGLLDPLSWATVRGGDYGHGLGLPAIACICIKYLYLYLPTYHTCPPNVTFPSLVQQNHMPHGLNSTCSVLPASRSIGLSGC